MLSLLRLGAIRAFSGTAQRGIGRAVPLARAFVKSRFIDSHRGLATVTAATGGTTTKTPRKPRSATASTGTKKPKTKKKAAAAPKKPKVKKVKKETLQPWQIRGADGKLVPLPSATKPKKGGSAYLFYIKSRVDALRNDPSMARDGAPGKLDVTKLTKTLASEWNSMSDSDKKPFVQQADEARRESEVALKRWRESLTSEDIKRQNAYLRAQKAKGKSPGMGKLKDPSKPKQPLSAFFQFLNEYRQKVDSSTTIKEIGKGAGSEWNSMSKEQKQPYEAKYEEARAQYQREMSQ